MGDSDKFSGISELYKRVMPAINAKLEDLEREKIFNITGTDIWNYCINYIWNDKKDLRIYELVDDILNIDTLKLQMYVKNKMKKE